MSTTTKPIVYAPGVGPDRAALLSQELGIRTTLDLVEHYPFRYVDKTQFHKISEATSSPIEVQIQGKITRIEEVGQPRQRRLVAHFTDGTGFLELVWFKGAKWIRKSLKIDTPLVVFGKVNVFNGKKSIPHPEISAIEQGVRAQALEPVYSSTEKLTKKGLGSKGLAKITQAILLEEIRQISDPFTPEFCKEHQLPSKGQALE